MPYNLFVRSLKTERGRRKGTRGVVINQELETEDSDLITFVYIHNTHDQVCDSNVQMLIYIDVLLKAAQRRQKSYSAASPEIFAALAKACRALSRFFLLLPAPLCLRLGSSVKSCNHVKLKLQPSCSSQ
jgi:hypothetical protein